MRDHKGSAEDSVRAQRGGSREMIVDAAVRLFLERGFASVRMDELAVTAGLARRTLYNQFTSKKEIFREVLLRVALQLQRAFPPGIETRGDVVGVLRLIGWTILELHKSPEYVGFLRMVLADSRQFPWIAKEFAAVIDPQTEQFSRYLAHLADLGVLNCPNPPLAAHQFMGILNEFSLWPLVTGRERVTLASNEDVLEEAIQMFLLRYRPGQHRGCRARRRELGP